MLMEEECKNNLKINHREIIENFRDFDDLEIYFLNRLYLIYLESKFKNEKFSRVYLTQLNCDENNSSKVKLILLLISNLNFYNDHESWRYQS